MPQYVGSHHGNEWSGTIRLIGSKGAVLDGLPDHIAKTDLLLIRITYDTLTPVPRNRGTSGDGQFPAVCAAHHRYSVGMERDVNTAANK